MRIWGWILVGVVTLGLLGCHMGKVPAVQGNVITEIHITCQTEEGLVQRHYTSQEKMRSVLLYIRSVSSPFSADSVPQEGKQVQITTVSADQTTKHYYQLGQRYFQEGDGGWKLIEPEKGANLWRLIKLLPSDPE